MYSELMRMNGMKKTCSKCNTEKELSGFKPDARYFLGVTGVCKECYNAYNRMNKSSQNWVSKNRELVKKNQRKYVKNNPDAVKESKRKWYKANLKKRLSNTRMYQLAKKNSIPKWFTKEHREQINMFYINCPEGYHVDHIIPLRGKNVCGLHVLSNLQYLKASENLRKSNKVT